MFWLAKRDKFRNVARDIGSNFLSADHVVAQPSKYFLCQDLLQVCSFSFPRPLIEDLTIIVLKGCEQKLPC